MLKQLKYLALSTLSAVLMTLPSQAAEKINFVYGPIKASLDVNSLDIFAKENIVNNQLAFYLNLLNADEEDKQRLREILTKKADLDPIIISRFLRTPLGESFLEQFGKIITVPGGRNGKYSIRGAIVTAALSEEGLSLLNFLHNFSTDLQLNVEKVLLAGEYIQILGRGTNNLVEATKELSAEVIETQNYDFTQLSDLRELGKYGVSPRQTLQLEDEKRQRKYYVHLYLPEIWREEKTPVVIMSHGLGSQPEHFAERAKHLNSYGYVVAVPQHPGSDFQYIEDLKEGLRRRVFELNEFIDRPLDISYLLDELEKLNQTKFNEHLDLDNVGILGHSFGGYTALALAGATIDFENLDKSCNRKVWSPNVSLLLQCQALDLPRQEYNLKDKRIKSVATINAVASSIFGNKGLNEVQVPVVFASGTRDPATPAAIEQLRPFVWVNSQDKYFILIEGQAHINTSQLDSSAKALFDSIPDLELPDQSIFDQYGNAFIVAFFANYPLNNPEFRPYFTSSYAEYLSEQSSPIYLIDKEAAIPLSELFNRLKPENREPIYPPNYSKTGDNK
jgi:predicted dienelactone hydrolase